MRHPTYRRACAGALRHARCPRTESTNVLIKTGTKPLGEQMSKRIEVTFSGARFPPLNTSPAEAVERLAGEVACSVTSIRPFGPEKQQPGSSQAHCQPLNRLIQSPVRLIVSLNSSVAEFSWQARFWRQAAFRNWDAQAGPAVAHFAASEPRRYQLPRRRSCR